MKNEAKLERWPPEPKVVSSNLAGRTIRKQAVSRKRLTAFLWFFVRLCRLRAT